MIEKIKEYITEILMAAIVIATIFILATGCSSLVYKYPQYFDVNKPSITHVLALTSAGDTVKIPISDIKPQSIYNVIGYDFNNMYPYNRYNWYDQYYNYNRNFGHYQGAQNSGSKIQYNNISPPSAPTSNGGGSGTSGFSGNPVATNPVTSGGGAKKKN